MLFNSVEFIFLFLPIVIIVYFYLNKKHLVQMANIWLLVSSFFFYGYITPSYVPILLSSVLINFAMGSGLNYGRFKSKINKKILLTVGIIINLAILGYFKYMDFFINNINVVFHSSLPLLHIALPLGISFFTFQQIAYLCDSYNGQTKEYDFLNYSLFVTFFPQLVAGPIVHHGEMMPQFSNLRNKFVNWENVCKGLTLFLIGLTKKVLIADTLAVWANLGFTSTAPLSCLEAWTSILSYTFQIYYDFSGYTDMALGIGLMFNIKLPQNFNNPYISLDIQDFWRRWHMTLSRFLKDYLYIPLGGNRKGTVRTYVNVAIVFLLCGLWHGASWMFVIWGALHGFASIITRLWKTTNIQMPKFLAWIMTFIFVNLAWVFFRAENLTVAKNVLSSAFMANGFSIPKINNFIIHYSPQVSTIPHWETLTLIVLPILIITIFVAFFHTKLKNFKPTLQYKVFIIILLMIILYKILTPNYTSPFIYFNF